MYVRRASTTPEISDTGFTKTCANLHIQAASRRCPRADERRMAAVDADTHSLCDKTNSLRVRLARFAHLSAKVNSPRRLEPSSPSPAGCRPVSGSGCRMDRNPGSSPGRCPGARPDDSDTLGSEVPRNRRSAGEKPVLFCDPVSCVSRQEARSCALVAVPSPSVSDAHRSVVVALQRVPRLTLRPPCPPTSTGRGGAGTAQGGWLTAGSAAGSQT